MPVMNNLYMAVNVTCIALVIIINWSPCKLECQYQRKRHVIRTIAM